MRMTAPKTNPLSLAALFSAILLLMPVAWVLGALSLWQIKYRPEKGDGAAFSIMALVLSAVLCPAALYLLLFTPPGKALDGCRQVQNEGSAELRLLGYLQQKHHDEHGRYGTTLKDIGFRNINGGPYVHSIVRADEHTYLVRGLGQNQMAGDVLEYDERKKLTKAYNRCVLGPPSEVAAPATK